MKTQTDIKIDAVILDAKRCVFVLFTVVCVSCEANVQNISLSNLATKEINTTNLKLNWGLSLTAYYDNYGDFLYEVDTDSTIIEYHDKDKVGGMLSLIMNFNLVKLKKQQIYGVVNFPVLKITSNKANSAFNKKTPIGFGFGIKGKKMPVIFTALVNFGNVSRLGSRKRNSNSFHNETSHTFINLEDYEEFTYEQTKVFYNVGVIIPIQQLFDLLTIIRVD